MDIHKYCDALRICIDNKDVEGFQQILKEHDLDKLIKEQDPHTVVGPHDKSTYIWYLMQSIAVNGAEKTTDFMHALINMPNTLQSRNQIIYHSLKNAIYADDGIGIKVLKCILDQNVFSQQQKNEALHIAVEYITSKDSATDKAELLLEYGAELKSVHDGKTLLHTAAESGRVSSINWVIGKGLNDLEVLDLKSGKTPLLCAASISRTSVALYLIQQGANPYAKDKEGNTLLHLAAREGNIPLMEELSKLPGFDLEAKNNKGYTPLLYALEDSIDRYDHISFSKQRLEFEESDEAALAAGWLVEHGASLRCKDENGDTPFHLATLRSHLGLLKTICARKDVNFNIQNKEGYKPTHPRGSFRSFGDISYFLREEQEKWNKAKSLVEKKEREGR